MVTEEELIAKAVAPRVTYEHLKSIVTKTQYYVFPDSLLTVCCLTLRNGFNVTGVSACVSPENFDADIGEKIALQNAINEIWALEGYLLKERQFHGN